ncbi:MAG: hypothetical protein GF349_01735 [Candidatus Magasanikbacteria bacterium]|nr:hypothetical protein [Candidatus Magasanikbacteria bacterium]
MLNRLTTKSIFLNWQTLFLLLVFFTIRFVSFSFHNHLIIQGILVFSLLMFFGIVYFKNPDWAFFILIGEIFLGGSGNYLEFAGLSIRTLLISIFLFLWTNHIIWKREFRKRFLINKYFTIILIILYLFLMFASINGIINGNNYKHIIQDLIPYLYLPLVFPTYHLLNKKNNYEYFIRLIIVFIIGSALFSIFTFIMFSSGMVELQEPFYKWFRDAANGKITNMGNGFFRIVLPEHLLIAPIILIISSLLMRDEHHHKMWRILLFLSIIILVLNLSRSFLLALFVGLLILKYKHIASRWFIVSCTTIGLVVLIFTSFSIVSSNGKTLGWELFGVRLASLASPKIETSSATRMIILPSILEQISENPMLGNGLGSSFTYLNPNSNDYTTTGQYDWGYLEMLAELGVIGSIILLAIYIFSTTRIINKIKFVSDWHDFYVGSLAAIIAMLVINITTPALFHTFGIIFIVLILSLALKPANIFEKLVTTLYRIFNRIKKRSTNMQT